MTVPLRPFEPVGSDQLVELGTQPIPVTPYCDPGYFDLERDAIFRRCWLHVGHLADLPEPGSYIVRELEIASASILIVRGKDGVIRAFHNVCTHRGTQLVAQESGRASKFSCPYHSWTFNDRGDLHAAPDFNRFFVEKADCSLKKVAVEICGGLIYINLDAKPNQSLAEFLGPLKEQLDSLPCATATAFAEYHYEIDANWKLVYDNFQEHYHLRFIHAKSSGGAGTGPSNPFGYATKFEFIGPHRKEETWFNPDFQPAHVQGIAMNALASDAIKQGFPPLGNAEYLCMFPNFFMFTSSFFPFSHTVFPVGPRKTRGVFRFYWQGEDDSASQRFAREYSLAAMRDVHAEDRAVIEAGQRGICSGAIEHIHFQAQEALCRHFFNTVDAAVQAYVAENRERRV